jgi:hypothetical protein
MEEHDRSNTAGSKARRAPNAPFGRRSLHLHDDPPTALALVEAGSGYGDVARIDASKETAVGAEEPRSRINTFFPRLLAVRATINPVGPAPTTQRSKFPPWSNRKEVTFTGPTVSVRAFRCVVEKVVEIIMSGNDRKKNLGPNPAMIGLFCFVDRT